MRFVLLTVAFFTACMTSVAAHPHATSLPSGSATAARVAKATPLDAGKRLQAQAGTEAVKVSLPPMPLPARQLSHTPERASAVTKETETKRSYGMPLAALALMVVIAVRRSKAGRL